MIDMHTHILPQLDDGAKDLETAVKLLEVERSQGVEKLVFTPHYYGRKNSPSQFLEKRNAAFERLRAKLPAGLTTRLGAEIHFTGVNKPDYDGLCSLALEGTKYLLLELPFTTAWTASLVESLGELISETGYTPIIAHVERYAEVQKNPALASVFANMGCLLQVNTQAFLDKKERKLAFALLKHGLVHCLGTDTHDLALRAPTYERAKACVEKAGFGSEWARVQEIMRRVWADERVFLPKEKRVRKFFGTYF